MGDQKHCLVLQHNLERLWPDQDWFEKGSVYLNILVEDVLANFGINGREGVVKKVDVSIGIQRPREVYLKMNIVADMVH